MASHGTTTNPAAKVSEMVSGAINGVTGAYTVPAQIGGKEVQFADTFDVISPSTGKLLHHCSSVSVEDATKAVEVALAAFPEWRDTLPAEKRNIFLKAAEIIEKRTKELIAYSCEETGATEFWSQFNLTISADIFRDVAGRISSIAGSIPTTSDKSMNALIFKEPYGVILAIAPWNAAYILGVRSIAYALAAGNTAILKAPEFSPRCSWAIADCLKQAGLPDGVLNVIAHKPASAAAVTKALIEHPSIKKVNFTGSTMVGRIIAELAGKNLKPVLLELGGKAPAIVWEDADLGLAAKECALGSFLHSGQICMSTERILVHKKISQEFELQFKAATAQIFAQAEVLVTKIGVEKNKALLRDAVSKGAKVLHGNIDMIESSETRMAPIVVKGIKKGMDLYYTESFGPSVSLIEIETEEEALQIANDTEYGLSAAIFTEDLRRGLRMAKAIESGACHINHMTVHDETSLPHGGMKSSGYGRFGSVGLDEWFRTKTVTYKV